MVKQNRPEQRSQKEILSSEVLIQRTDLNENCVKISVWSSSPLRCDLRLTQYGSGVKNWTNGESVHQEFKKFVYLGQKPEFDVDINHQKQE